MKRIDKWLHDSSSDEEGFDWKGMIFWFVVVSLICGGLGIWLDGPI